MYVSNFTDQTEVGSHYACTASGVALCARLNRRIQSDVLAVIMPNMNPSLGLMSDARRAKAVAKRSLPADALTENKKKKHSPALSCTSSDLSRLPKDLAVDILACLDDWHDGWRKEKASPIKGVHPGVAGVLGAG